MTTADATCVGMSATFLDPQLFTTLIEQAPGLALVDFTADHCPPCRMMAPHVDKLAQTLAGSVVVAKVDCDAHPEIAARFGVRGTPTLIFFRGGQVVDRIVGAVPPERLLAACQRLREIPAAVDM